MSKNQSINTKNIKTLTQEQQVLNRINMYLGSLETIQDEHPCIVDQTFQYTKNKYSIGSQQLFYEIIQNSIDNYIKSNKPKNYYIDITLSSREFTVKNNGRVFNLKDDQKCFDDIDRVVSVLNTSSNYTESAQTAGTNGLGAKLVCLTQQLFEITVQNNNLKYISTWKNMKESHTQKCQKCKSENYFQVHVKLLPQKYKKQITKDISKEFNFIDLDIPAINFYLMNLAQILPIKISVNNHLLKSISITELFQPQNQFIFQNEDLSITLLYKSQLKKDFAFINGILCYDSPAFNDIRNQIKEYLNMKSIKVDCQIIIQGFRKDIKYNEQIKNKMTTKFPKILNQIKPTQKNQLLDFVKLMIESKTVRNKDFYLRKYHPANKSNSKVADCSLILTEGNSAASLFNQIPTKYCNPKNRQESFFDFHGLFPLRGKVTNTMKKDKELFSREQDDRDEIKNIVKIIGFQQGVTYTHENIKNLRYHSIIIASDYDDDGFHIKGLILQFLLKQWPELLDLGFFKQFTTPIIVADDIEYYQDSDFDRTQKHKHVKYYKGLGSIDKSSKLFTNICTNFNSYIKDITSLGESWTENMNGLFGKDSDIRKNFIIHYQPRSIDHTQNYIKINDILTQQVVEYSFKTLERAIPCIMDGLKDSQRKIIYHASTRKFYEKVANFAADVSKTYDYHHGEGSLSGAIELLAQDCVGTNNCPLLKGVGQFGNNWNPEDIAADRYIYVTNSEWLTKLIRPEDKLLYKYNLSDDGKTIEPQQLYPIMPIFLLNGVTGVASGWSSTIPCFKFEDVRQYIIKYLKDQPVQELHPYYNNYLGKTEFQKINGKQTFINEGYYEEYDTYYDIYETHLGTTKAKLFDQLQEKYQIFPKRFSIKLKGQQDQVDIIRVTKASLKNITFDELYKKYLTNTRKMENMTLIEYCNKQIIPKQFDNIDYLMSYWITLRLIKYCQRKQLQLKELLKQFIIRYNYNEVKTKNLLDKISDESLTYRKLSYLTPFSQIPEIAQKFDDISKLKEFLDKSFKKVQSEEQSEYDYITDKSVKYFTRGEFNLKELEEKYNKLKNTSAKELWIEELNEIKV